MTDPADPADPPAPPEGMPAFGAWSVTVRYGRGRAPALVAASVSAPRRSVTAVVGGDGAGKSTLLKVLAGAVTPAAGTVRRPPARRIGFVSGVAGGYADLTVTENLAFVSGAYGLGRARAAARTAGLLERTGLAGAADRLAGNLSGGMRQKLALAMALLPQPDLLVLDEPTTGVDPVSRAALWRLIAAAAAGGAAVVLATTYLEEAERAETVLVLHEGRTLVAGSPDEVVAAVPGTVVEAPVRPEGLAAWRLGPRWRAWSPGGAVPAGAVRAEPRLEDAVIVATLERRGAAR